jgi:wyosine [tRNA(Phe)-imidazoG37] synthetase (radical SAM superfamily)
MSTFLFNDIVFGPVKSRRLGASLGINLLPTTKKICNFNCIYCECGLTNEANQLANNLPSRKEVYAELEKKLLAMKEKRQRKNLDVITFAGNGEPTMHPEFSEIISDTIELRNNIFPNTKIAVLSNATTIKNPKVKNALLTVDQNILKLDSACDSTIELHNKPNCKIYAAELINDLKSFNGKLIVQTLFIKGISEGKKVDNTTAQELAEWVKAIDAIRPAMAMVYTISRSVPDGAKLEKISNYKLHSIARNIDNLGIKTQVSG